MAKLLPSRPRIGVGMGTCGSGNGAEGVYHAFAEAISQQGRDVRLASVEAVRLPRAGTAGQRANSGPPPGDSAPRAGQATLPPAPRRPWPPAPLKPKASRCCKIEEWDHLTPRTSLYGQGYPDIPSWQDHSLLQAAEEDRAAQLRFDIARRYRGIHRHRRLPGALQQC